MKLGDFAPVLEFNRMTVRQLALLIALGGLKEKISFRNLARAMKVPPPSVCRAIDALCILKLAERLRDEDDRRNVYIILTDKGRKLFGEIGK